MTIDTQWRYKNTAVPTQTFENPEDFFDSLYTGAIDAEDIKKHKENNLKNVEAFDSYLLADKKTVITCRRFKTINEYNEWKRVRELLPRVDFHVSEEEAAGEFINAQPGTNVVTIPPIDTELWGQENKNEEFN
jgi:hypothetical protein|tara:strand:+ start:138 stop:536 length:399 start_codon:yes stop_codon:yes gene_type:complete